MMPDICRLWENVADVYPRGPSHFGTHAHKVTFYMYVQNRRSRRSGFLVARRSGFLESVRAPRWHCMARRLVAMRRRVEGNGESLILHH